MGEQVKLTEYQQSVVDLSNARDKANMQAVLANQDRNTLNGAKISSAEQYTEEHAAYLLVDPPSEQTLTVIAVSHTFPPLVRLRSLPFFFLMCTRTLP